MNSDTPPEAAPSLIDEPARRRFEAAWRAGHPEPIEGFLPPPDSPKHLPTLEELVLIELEFAWKPAPDGAVSETLPLGARRPLVEDYLKRFPCLDNPEIVRRLLEQEHEVRARRGDAPSAGEYRARFPTVGFTVPNSDTARPDPAPSLCIPGYTILGTIGRGGMGVVYKARQLSLDRVVALKVILAGAHAGAEELARFKAEAHAAATLQHPNIVQIHEIGEQAGRPYLVMEYVEGGSLARQLNGTPQPPRDAAALVETLARAVQVMHERGIVHRDLKPHNVLLSFSREQPAVGQTFLSATPEADRNVCPTAEGSHLKEALPKIADFGLAKRLDETDGATWSGAILGTPGYMAPEQAAGRARHVGPAADVWALGTILYEMLTGRPPFTAAAAIDVLAQIMAAEPVAPRRLQPKVPRDLETVCLKCLEKDPRKRYASAAALADDCAAFLRDEPIKARPTPVWRRAAKWARRRPAAAALLLVSAAAVLAVLLGVAWHNARLGDALARAEAERERARANYRLAREAVEQMLTRVGRDRLAYVPQMEHVRREILDDALRFHRRFLEDNRDDPEVRHDTARAYETVGRINQSLGRHAEAETAFRKAIHLFDGLAADSAAAAGIRDELAQQHNNLALLLQDRGRFPEARTAFGTAVALGERLTDAFLAEPLYRRHLAGARANLAVLLETLGDFTEAEKLYRHALADYRKLHAGDPAHRVYRQHLAQVHNNLAVLLTTVGNLTEAAASGKTAFELRGQLVKDAPEVPEYRHDLAGSCITRGNLLSAAGRRAEALAAQREAVNLLRRLVKDFPATPRYRLVLVRALVNLGGQLVGEADRGPARTALDEALALARQLRGEFPDAPEVALDLVAARLNGAALLRSEGRFAEAADVCREAEALLPEVIARNPGLPGPRSRLGSARTGRGRALAAAGRHADAERAYREAIDTLGALVADFPRVPEWRAALADTRMHLAVALTRQKRPGEARKEYEASLAVRRQLASDFPGVVAYRQWLARGLIDLSSLLAAVGEPARAREAVEEAVRVQEWVVNEYPDVPDYQEDLGRHYYALGNLLPRAPGRMSAPQRAYKRALDVQEALVAKHPEVAAYRWDLAATLYAAGRLFVQARGDAGMTRTLAGLAVEHQRKGVKLDDRDPAPRLLLKEYQWWFAKVLLAQGRHRELEQAADELAEFDPDDSRGHYYAAGFLASCVPLVGKDAKAARAYADRAVAQLRRAVEKGFKDIDGLRTDSAFDPIRQREDFQAIVRELAAAKAPR